jgi:hypothetical protein
MTLLSETLPWHVQYSSFAGTLPNITTLNLSVLGASINVREPIFGILCLGRSAAERPMTLGATREAGGLLTTAAAGGTISTSCGANGTLGGSGTVSLLGSATRITVTLIEGGGGLRIAPDPIRIDAPATRKDVILTNPGTGGTRITSIGLERLIREDFIINDANRCERDFVIYPNREPRECRFTLEVRNVGRSGLLIVRYGLSGSRSATATS